MIDGETGIISGEETPAAVADGVAALLKTPEKYQPFREKGCERTKAFHWDNVLPGACAWLEEMAAQKRACQP